MTSSKDYEEDLDEILDDEEEEEDEDYEDDYDDDKDKKKHNKAWFESDEGIDEVEKACTYKNFLLEKKVVKNFENSEYQSIGFASFSKIETQGIILPRVYFEHLIGCFSQKDNDILEYVAPTTLLVYMLESDAKNYRENEDGELESCPRQMEIRDLVSEKTNPVLYFAGHFNCFNLEEDENGTWEDKFDLYKKALTFVWICKNKGYTNVINDNPWLFEKSIYLNDFNTARKQKSFMSKIKEFCKDDKYIEMMETVIEND